MKTIYKGTSLLAVTLISAVTFCGCKKDFLEAKPSTTLIQPHSLEDFQGLLNNTEVFNTTGSLPLAASDEYVIPDYGTYLGLIQATTKKSYTWESDLYSGQNTVQDWSIPYSAIFYANSVLEGLQKIEKVNHAEWNRTKGWALFSRAYAYYDLAQNFCEAYNPDNANVTPGLPLRTNSGVDEVLPRSTLNKTYELIIDDLKKASALIPNKLSTEFRNQPSKAAVFALFSRLYLNMGNYVTSEIYADSCLALTKKLIDYNTVSKTSSTPFNFSNDESIYYSVSTNDLVEVTTSTLAKYSISPDLLALFDARDLRTSIYFTKASNGNFLRKRGYSGRARIYTGLATDEIYLIKSECAARRSDLKTAVDLINFLLVNRYETGSFSNISSTSKSEVLEIIQTERKKELIRRGLRWSDLKRMNQEGKNITLTRSIAGVTYKLNPNDPKYLFPIPNDEINYSGIAQNIR